MTIWLGVIVAVLGGLGIVKAFLIDTFPWLWSIAGAGGFAVAAALMGLVLIYMTLLYLRHKRAAKRLAWRYIIDVQDANRGKPGHGDGQSDEVKRGAASADREWGDRLFREVGLPPESEYR